MPESLAGIRVQIKIDEDGSSSPAELPPGTIIRSINGPDGTLYYLVRLDHPVKCKHARTEDDWVLNILALSSRSKGTTLEQILSSSRALFSVAIGNMFYLPGPDDPLLDFSKGEYFAIGTVKKAS